MGFYDNCPLIAASHCLGLLEAICRDKGMSTRRGVATRNGCEVQVLRVTAAGQQLGDELRTMRTDYQGFLIQDGDPLRVAFVDV